MHNLKFFFRVQTGSEHYIFVGSLSDANSAALIHGTLPIQYLSTVSLMNNPLDRVESELQYGCKLDRVSENVKRTCVK